MLCNGDGVPADKQAAADLYRRTVDLVDPGAQCNLAFTLDSGEGMSQDRTETERLFRPSADQDDTNACLCIGRILYKKGDYPGAEDHLTSAAMKDDVKAAYNLGLIYSGGSLGEPDLGKTEECFKTAASEGFTYTQTGLGGILYGRGNIAGAKRWFHLAADQGEPTAMYNLGTFNASGMVEMSERRAMELLARAASADIEEARVLISKLTSGGL